MAIVDFMTQNVAGIKSSHPDSRIGTLLVRSGRLSQDDAERIARMQQKEGLRFGELAVKLSIVSREDVQSVLATQSGQMRVTASSGTLSHEILVALDHAGQNIERLQSIRSQLLLDWFKEDQKSLLFTGPNGGEGVSYIAAALAVVFASLPKRTLLIDANLRMPRQHELFGLDKNAHGLSSMLSGRAGLETIAPVTEFEHLSILPAGTPPTNPAELLSRDTFSKLLSDCAERYDVILVDGPAATAPELPILAKHVGGVSVITRRGGTNLQAVRDVVELATRAKVQLVGAILNDP